MDHKKDEIQISTMQNMFEWLYPKETIFSAKDMIELIGRTGEYGK